MECDEFLEIPSEHLLFEIEDFARLTKIIKELLLSCEDEDSEDGVKKNTQVEFPQTN